MEIWKHLCGKNVHQWPHTEILRVGFCHFKTDFIGNFTGTQLPIHLQRVSLYFKLSRYPCLIPLPTSSHSQPSLVMTLPDDLAGARPRHIHHYPYISLSISGTVVRIKFQIPRPVPPPLRHTAQLLFPSNERRIHEVVKKHHWHMILQHLCIGLWPWITHRLQPSTLEGAKSRVLLGVYRGITERERTFQK